MRFSFFFRLPVLLFLVHAFVAWRLASDLTETVERIGAAALLVFSYVVLMAGFMAREKVGERVSDAVSWAGFLMLGLFSWLFILTVLRDVLLALLVVLKLNDGFGELAWVMRFDERSVYAVFALSAVACLYGLFNARRRPAVVGVDVFIKNLPSDLDGFRIVQITDLHVGPTIKRGFVQQVVDTANDLGGDVIVLTGDLVDGSVDRLRRHTAPLAQLKAQHGVYAVTGNHEYYVGVHPWVAELERLGISVLLNAHRLIQKNQATLLMAGVTDFGAEKFVPEHASDPGAAIRHAPDADVVKILLAHQPRSIFAAAQFKFDLQLSGHTHGGQFWPWNYFVPLQQPFVAGLHKHLETQVYVSRGTGYWGPPLRLGARAEISCIHLRPSVT